MYLLAELACAGYECEETLFPQLITSDPLDVLGWIEERHGHSKSIELWPDTEPPRIKVDRWAVYLVFEFEGRWENPHDEWFTWRKE